MWTVNYDNNVFEISLGVLFELREASSGPAG